MPHSLAHNLARVRSRIDAAARAAGRDPGAIVLVAVTKSVAPERALALARLGVADLGENRADELERKAAFLAGHGQGARWHFVGHLQRNKAARVARLADVVHSVDSLRLLETLDRNAGDVGRSLGVYLQVKLHPEATKSGLDPHDLARAVAAARAARHLDWLGLMTMAPLETGDREYARALADGVFARLAELGREHGARGLSMGMSDDFERAIAHGSTCVRVGSALFEGLASSEVRA